MTQRLVKHGSEAGYKEHLKQDEPACERCQKAHRQYAKQFRPTYKKQGMKYTIFDVIDAEYDASKSQRRVNPIQHRIKSPESFTEPRVYVHGQEDESEPELSSESPIELSMAQRLSAAILGAKPDQIYVETNEIPDYLTPLDPDPEPEPGDQFIVTKEARAKMEGNLASYLAMLGMPLELIDPYCGPILGENLDNIVHRWVKVIGHYPNSWIAKHLMSDGGGVFADWIGAIQATWPVIFAIYEHHLAHTIKVEKGQVMRVHSNGQHPNEGVDATMPQYEYTTQ